MGYFISPDRSDLQLSDLSYERLKQHRMIKIALIITQQPI